MDENIKLKENKMAKYALKENKIVKLIKESTNFNTKKYFNTHLKEPKGRGSWVFSQEGKEDEVKNWVFSPPNLTLKEAKEWLKNHPIAKNWKNVTIMP